MLPWILELPAAHDGSTPSLCQQVTQEAEWQIHMSRFCGTYLTLVGTRAEFTALMASSKFSSSSGTPSLLTKIPDKAKSIRQNTAVITLRYGWNPQDISVHIKSFKTKCSLFVHFKLAFSLLLIGNLVSKRIKVKNLYVI